MVAYVTENITMSIKNYKKSSEKFDDCKQFTLFSAVQLGKRIFDVPKFYVIKMYGYFNISDRPAELKDFCNYIKVNDCNPGWHVLTR